MTLSKYICDLLYRYNCVIIPEFGAFLTQRIPATLSKETQLFFPPQKRISFNNQVTNNDGLLANYVAKSENISYEKAMLKVQYFVQEIQQKLANEGRFSLTEIGFFTKDIEQNIVFEPLHTTNYLTEAFGLNSFKTLEVARNLTIEENAIPVIESSSEALPPKSNFKLKYAAVGLLLLGLTSVGVNSYQQQKNSQYVEVSKQVDNYIQSASFVMEINEALPSIEVEVKKAENTVQYYIIAGAFREYKNATKKLKQLQRKGFNPVYIGANKYGLHQVAYSTFTNQNDAVNNLNKVKRTENSAAWLFTVKK